jgi:hypothetical protein
LTTTAATCKELLDFALPLTGTHHNPWKAWLVEAFPFLVHSARFTDNTRWTVVELISELLLMSGHVNSQEIIPHFTTAMILYNNIAGKSQAPTIQLSSSGTSTNG